MKLTHDKDVISELMCIYEMIYLPYHFISFSNGKIITDEHFCSDGDCPLHYWYIDLRLIKKKIVLIITYITKGYKMQVLERQLPVR